MPIGFDIGTALYHLGIRAAAPFNPKAKLWVEGRRGLWERLKSRSAELKGCLWMHCASLGEFEQGRPVLERLKQERPNLPVLLTFFSPSGHEMMKNYPIATHVEYLPPDSNENAIRLLDLLQPCAAIFVKYEFWYHHLHSLHRKKIPAFLVSAHFRPDQVFFKWFGGTYRKMLGFFDHIFVQDQHSADLLRSIGRTNVSISGDTRADRVISIVDRNEELEQLRPFSDQNSRPILICGSTWPEDEKILIPGLSQLKEPIRLIIAPHELGERRINELETRLLGKVSRISGNSIANETNVLLIDKMGLLARAYKYGDIAYVGGGFFDGIHNVLEPAAWGIPVIFGPDHKKFNEAKGLIDAGGGFQVKDRHELARILEQLINDGTFRKKAGAAAAEYVRKMAGATQKITSTILRSI
ncbi:MAG: 3-deoxy-D-manno-octulosonic acid transferase [Bacteroidota bacterium]|nr:3-deoxy-D-manno-octulosonic acid transferase [Bacteroidota bacterium]